MDVLEGVVGVIGHEVGARDEALGRRVVIVHDHVHACNIKDIHSRKSAWVKYYYLIFQPHHTLVITRRVPVEREIINVYDVFEI